jgi:hypothetical protein
MKWADYTIVGVHYRDDKRHILEVKMREDDGEKLINEQRETRQQVVSMLERGVKIITCYLKDNKWQKGDEVMVVNINNTKFIRTDGDKIEEDNLGELPEY